MAAEHEIVWQDGEEVPYSLTFTLPELKDAEFLEVIGSGTEATVYKLKVGDKVYAAKVVSYGNEARLALFMNEVKTYQLLSDAELAPTFHSVHKCVAKAFSQEGETSKDLVVIVSELFEMTLFQALEKRGDDVKERAKVITAWLLEADVKIHKMDFAYVKDGAVEDGKLPIYSDITLNNIVINFEPALKVRLIDFGYMDNDEDDVCREWNTVLSCIQNGRTPLPEDVTYEEEMGEGDEPDMMQQLMGMLPEGGLGGLAGLFGGKLDALPGTALQAGAGEAKEEGEVDVMNLLKAGISAGKKLVEQSRSDEELTLGKVCELLAQSDEAKSNPDFSYGLQGLMKLGERMSADPETAAKVDTFATALKEMAEKDVEADTAVVKTVLPSLAAVVKEAS
ncbi:Hypothetical protein POVN_LOCUS234 [uncultured virus]|nr:Hypothetical protein POVN_LOCUS234 [uncultured virus]